MCTGAITQPGSDQWSRNWAYFAGKRLNSLPKQSLPTCNEKLC